MSAEEHEQARETSISLRRESLAYLEDAMKNGKTVTGTVVKQIKGGAVVQVGHAPAFLPASQAGRLGHVTALYALVDMLGTEQHFHVLSVDPKKYNVILSRKEWQAEQAKLHTTNYTRGMRVTGTVVHITELGAFVMLDEFVTGLIHWQEIGWAKLPPADQLSLGEQVTAEVVYTVPAKGHVALSRKACLPSPWENILDRYNVGQTVTGAIIEVNKYGSKIQLEAGLYGFLPRAETCWDPKPPPVPPGFFAGGTIELIILGISPETEEMILSHRQLTADPWTLVPQLYPVGTRFTGAIRNIQNYGLFVRLPTLPLDGLVHRSALPSANTEYELTELYAKLEMIDVEVVSMDVAEQRLTLTPVL